MYMCACIQPAQFNYPPQASFDTSSAQPGVNIVGTVQGNDVAGFRAAMSLAQTVVCESSLNSETILSILRKVRVVIIPTINPGISLFCDDR